MGQHADLGGDVPAGLDLLEPVQHPPDALHTVVHRVKAQHRVPRAEGEALQQGGHDAVGIVGGMVGLEAAGQGTRQADGGVAVGGDADFFGRVDEIQIAHQLGHGGDHLRRQAAAHPADGVAAVFFIQQPLPQLGHRPVPDLLVDLLVHVVLDDAGDLVLLVGNGGVGPQIGQGEVGHHHLGRHPLLGVLRRNARQPVAGLLLVCFGQGVLYRLKLVHVPQQLCFEYHVIAPSRLRFVEYQRLDDNR